MLSNNADEFVSGFRLRVIAVLGSDECAPRTARSTSSGALLLGAVVPEPVVVLVSLLCRSWSALKMEDMQSGLRFDGKPRGRRRTPPIAGLDLRSPSMQACESHWVAGFRACHR